MSQSVPWIKSPVYTSPTDKITSTNVTTLENGLRVASEPMFGEFCTLGGSVSCFLLLTIDKSDTTFNSLTLISPYKIQRFEEIEPQLLLYL